MRKYEIASLLARQLGFSSYLEICTPTTGGTFALVDREQFQRVVRLMYRCPTSFTDGEPVELATAEESAEALYAKLMRSGEKFDLVFVDPFHSYASSLRDLVFALQLVRDDGVVMVHDCNPPNGAVAQMECRDGDWCGVTFAAYLDVVLFSEGLSHFTVDTDYGCGVISKNQLLRRCFDFRQDAGLAARWLQVDLFRKYSLLERARAELLHLISPEEFSRKLLDCLPS